MFKLESQKLVKLNGIENDRVRNSVACTEFENATDPPGGQPEPGRAGPGRLGLLPPGQPESQQPVTRFRAAAAYHSQWAIPSLYV